MKFFALEIKPSGKTLAFSFAASNKEKAAAILEEYNKMYAGYYVELPASCYQRAYGRNSVKEELLQDRPWPRKYKVFFKKHPKDQNDI